MKTKTQYFERITIIGDKGDISTAIKKCTQDGYDIIRSGPRKLSIHQVSDNEFMIIAEKEIEKP